VRRWVKDKEGSNNDKGRQLKKNALFYSLIPIGKRSKVISAGSAAQAVRISVGAATYMEQ
jgi:hypothetical protein